MSGSSLLTIALSLLLLTAEASANSFKVNGADPIKHLEMEGRFAAELSRIGRIQGMTKMPTNDPGNIDPETGHLRQVYGRGTFVVISPCMILTNSHVIFGSSQSFMKDSKAQVTFLNADKKEKVMSAKPVAFLASDRGDLLLMRLQTCEGKSRGFIPVDTDTEPTRLVGSKVIMPGFPGDREASVHWGHTCRITGFGPIDSPYSFTHDCSSQSGSSGSPLMAFKDGRMTVFALNTMDRNSRDEVIEDYSQDYTNLATTLAFMSQEMKDLIAADIKSNAPKN